MAFDSTIPALGNLISNDIPAMQENFSLLESAQVVDEGSTSDGDYIRYENGWQVCISPVANIPDDYTTRDYAKRTNAGSWYNWTYPVDFSEIPSVSTTSISGQGSVFGAQANVESTNCDIYVLAIDDGEGGQDLKAIAIGRWK